MTSKPNRWILPSKDSSPVPQQARLFCFSYAGGGAAVFRNWPTIIHGKVGLYSVVLPGRESRYGETLFTSMAPLVQALANQITEFINVPYAFFGHSMGALLNFELARELRRRGLPQPIHLFVSAHRGPQMPDPDPPIYHLPEPEFVAKVSEYGGTPQEVFNNKELRDLVVPVLRADLTVCETYQYRPEAPLDCPISAFAGVEDFVTKDEVAGWQEQTTKTFKLRVISGNHFFLHEGWSQMCTDILSDLNKIL